MAASQHQLLHATCVSLERQGVLLLGPSGSGKSDLALRMIERGAELVADDQVELTADRYGLWACAPLRISGLLEVRGVGILRLAYQRQMPVRLVVALERPETPIERLPEADPYEALGHRVSRIHLHAFESSAPTKILFALRAMAQGSSVEGCLTETV